MYVTLLSLVFLPLSRASILTDVQGLHLVRCLETISYRYFSTEQTLVISHHDDTVEISGRICENFTKCHGNTFDVVKLIFEKIHKSEWISIVVSSTYTNPQVGGWNSNDRHGSYILLTSNEIQQEFHIVKSVREQLERLSSNPGWNPRARFVVTVMNICCTFDAENLSRRILEELWNRKVVNAIILLPVTYDSQSQDLKCNATGDIGLVPKLGLYTWFPYRDSNQCSRVDEVVLIDMWLMAGKGSFVSNTFLFPRKIRNNLQGCELRVSTVPGLFVVRKTTKNLRNNINITYDGGWEILLINTITKTMNMKITFLPPSETFRQIQDEFGNFTGYMAQLVFDEADIAFSGLLRTMISESLTDVTKTYHYGQWEWYVSCPVKIPRWRSIFRIFSASLWLTVVLSILLANVVTVFLAKFESKELKSFRRFVNSITNTWAVLLSVSLSTMPRTTPLRMFFFSWVCYSLAINIVFQAYLTTFLVEPGFEKAITSVEEMFTSGIKYGIHPFLFDQYYTDTTGSDSRKFFKNPVNCTKLELCFTWTSKYRNISFISSPLIVDYFYHLSQTSDDNEYRPICRIDGASVIRTDMVMLLQKGSPFLDRVNEIISRVSESGIFNQWIQESPERKSPIKSTAMSKKSLGDEFYNLNMMHMQSAFYLLLFTEGLGFISFLMELLYFQMHLQRHKTFNIFTRH
jgi:hypothetical protein